MVVTIIITIFQDTYVTIAYFDVTDINDNSFFIMSGGPCNVLIQ
jgi:hypothetical protein